MAIPLLESLIGTYLEKPISFSSSLRISEASVFSFSKLLRDWFRLVFQILIQRI